MDRGGGLVSGTIGAITHLIRGQDPMPGDRLPSEAALARDLRVSRTVVREAFRALAAMRIIARASGKRATVAPLDHGAMSLIIEHGVHTDQISIQQICDVRRTIESRIARRAALRRTEEEAQERRAGAAAMRESLGAPAAREAMIANQGRIAAAVAEGDPERAVAALAQHFDASVRAPISAGLI